MTFEIKQEPQRFLQFQTCLSLFSKKRSLRMKSVPLCMDGAMLLEQKCNEQTTQCSNYHSFSHGIEKERPLYDVIVAYIWRSYDVHMTYRWTYNIRVMTDKNGENLEYERCSNSTGMVVSQAHTGFKYYFISVDLQLGFCENNIFSQLISSYFLFFENNLI